LLRLIRRRHRFSPPGCRLKCALHSATLTVLLDRWKAEYPSGQRGLTVNQVAKPSKVRILPRPLFRSTDDDDIHRGVAQLGRALRSGRRGRRFKSYHPDLMFWVYVLQSEVTSRFYTGSCEDLDLRLHQHNSALNPSTKHGVPWRLIHSESFSTRPEAVRRERFLKTGKGREELCQLVESQRRSSGRRGDRP